MRANAGGAWGYSDSILFIVHAPGVPADPDWSEFTGEVWPRSGVRGVLVVASGSRLTPLQRAEIQRWHERPLRTQDPIRRAPRATIAAPDPGATRQTPAPRRL